MHQSGTHSRETIDAAPNEHRKPKSFWGILGSQLSQLPERIYASLSPGSLRKRMEMERERPDAFSSNRIVASYLFLYLALVCIPLIAVASLQRSIGAPVEIAPDAMAFLLFVIAHLVISSHTVKLTRLMGYLIVLLIAGILCVLSYRNAGIIAPGLLFLPPLAAAAIVLLPGSLRPWCLGCTIICLLFAGSTSIGMLGVPTGYSHDAAVQTQAIFLVFSSVFLVLLVTLFVIDRDITHSIYRRQNLELKAASRARKDFVTMMSHELRTPMNAILGSLEILKRTDEPRSQAEMISLIEDAGYALTTQLDDLLDQSRIEAGKLSLMPSPVLIGDLVNRTMRLWRARADDNGLFMTHVQDRCGNIAVMADRVRLQQVLSNLLSNAIKFTAQGGIRIHTETEVIGSAAVQVSIIVEDTGPGIPEDDLHKIFEPFSQSLQVDAPGSGLGLSISKRLLQLMNGTLTAANGSNGGARMSVKFTAPIAIGAVEPTSQQLDDPLRNEAPIRILCVDDHPANLRIVSVLLETFGYVVKGVSSGHEALDVCANERFDVIFLDVMMPGIDGMETTRLLRSGDTLNADTPIVALTANVMPDQVLKYQECGMNGVVSKPIDSRILLSALERALSNMPFIDETMTGQRFLANGTPQ